MNACWCILGNTDACKNCVNNKVISEYQMPKLWQYKEIATTLPDWFVKITTTLEGGK